MDTSVQTVMFTDIVGSVKMYSQVSDSVAVDLVNQLQRMIQAALPEYQGTFIKSTGDGQILIFDEVGPATRCADQIHGFCKEITAQKGQELSERITLHTGEVFHTDGDIHGNTVNLSARLLNITGAGETGVTSDTWASMNDEEKTGFFSHGPEVFKGFTRFTNVHKKATKEIPTLDVTLQQQPGDSAESTVQITANMPKNPVYIVTLDHPQGKEEIKVKEGRTHIFGRSPECTTQISDRMFSGTHGALATVEGILWVFDLKSSNGIMYKGRKIQRRKPCEIGTVIELPTGTLTIRLP